MRKADKVRLGIVAGVLAALFAGAGVLAHAKPEWASAVGTTLILLLGVPLSLVGLGGLKAGLRYRGSPSPSIGPGLGAALALVIGVAASAVGLPLLIWGVLRLVG